MMGMLEDDRKVFSISREDNNRIFIVGYFGITKIEIYAEPGQYGVVPWAAIWKGDWISDRLEMTGWSIHYGSGRKNDTLSV